MSEYIHEFEGLHYKVNHKDKTVHYQCKQPDGSTTWQLTGHDTYPGFCDQLKNYKKKKWIQGLAQSNYYPPLSDISGNLDDTLSGSIDAAPVAASSELDD